MLTRRRPFKIALLATVVEYGGSEKVILTLIKNIDSSLFELVPVIFTRPEQANGVFFKELNKTGITYHKIYVNKHKLKYLNPFMNIVEAYKLLKKEKFDIVHTNGYRADFLGIFLALLTGLPIISTCHGYISNDTALKLYNRLNYLVLRFFDKILAVSEGIKEQLVRNGVPESSLEVVLNAVQMDSDTESLLRHRKEKRELFCTDENDFLIGYIGRLSKEKGIRYLIEACAKLDKVGLPLKVLVIGDGPQRDDLEKLAQKNGLQNKVFFLGFLSDVENWMPAIDVFVLPSLTEGTPMALLEAMAMGVPVVATNVGGVPDIINNGVNGILVESQDSDNLARTLNDLFQHPREMKIMSDNARETIKNQFNVYNWCRSIEKQYYSLIEHKLNKKNGQAKNTLFN